MKLSEKLRDMHRLAGDSCDPEFNAALLQAADQLDKLAKPITMQEIRLCVGEGKLPAWAVLDGANAVLRQRQL